MAVFRVEKNSGYTVMSNHHLRNRALSLKAKGLLSQMLSLPEDWDYTLQGLARINRESIDAIRQAIRELEQAGYIQRSRERDEKGRLRGADYVIFELPQPVPASVSPTLENPFYYRKKRFRLSDNIEYIPWQGKTKRFSLYSRRLSQKACGFFFAPKTERRHP